MKSDYKRSFLLRRLEPPAFFERLLIRLVMCGLAGFFVVATCACAGEGEMGERQPGTAGSTASDEETTAPPASDGETTAPPWTRAELRAMIPGKKAFANLGPYRMAYPEYTDNAYAAELSTDPDDTAADLASRGRLGGFRGYVDAACSGSCGPGLVYMIAQVDVFKTPEEASAFVGDWISRLADAEGRTLPPNNARHLVSVEEFEPARVGDETAGARYWWYLGSDLGSEREFSTLVVFRLGNLVGSTDLVSLDDPSDYGDGAHRLAKLLEQRMRDALSEREQ